MLVRCLNTVYLNGKKYDRQDGEWDWPDAMQAEAIDLCERGYLELITQAKPVEDDKPKGKRGA